MHFEATQVLAWALALAGGTSAAYLLSRLRRERSVLAEVAHAAHRLVAGESHVVAPEHAGAAGEVARLVNALGDLVRREQLKMHPERIFEQAMVRETPNGLIVVDGRGVIQSVNPAGLALLPWVGDPVGTAAADAPLADLATVVREAADGRHVTERSTRCGTRDLLVRGVPLADGGGTLGVVLDISTLVAAERLRRDFVANVSHELRTPITAIVGYAEALQDEEMSEAARPLLATLVRNTARLNRLCDDVLALSRLEARTSHLPVEAALVLPMAEAILDGFRDHGASLGLSLAAHGDPDAAAHLNGDAFDAALGNLVDNALKYTPRGGRVTVRVNRVGDRVWVNVEDTGIGIDVEHHPRLFERFYRVDPGRARDVGGTGLGLALVKHYCRAMGAEIHLRSSLGEGSTFSLVLPAADSALGPEVA